MSRSYTLGPTGTIPYDEYFRKIQSANMYEEPDQYETYIRGELADFRPDAPYLESDQTRDPNDRGSGFGSRERLNLRYSGARSEEDPYLPDGTFLDHEFMERDPRGTQNLPDFSAYRAQMEARGKFIKFYNDEDYSVPESGVNPVQMVQKIRSLQADFKNRFKNFEESKDSWHNGGGARKLGDRRAQALVTSDGTILDLADATARQREDPVSLLSNINPALLRLTSPDHRIKIARYGSIRAMQDIGHNNWGTNRNNSYMDHQIPVELNGQMVNRMLATVILDIEGQRLTKQAVAQGVDYDDSLVNQMREAKMYVPPEDLYKMIKVGLTSQTGAKSANEMYFEGMTVRRFAKKDKNIRTALNNTELNHHIIESMVQANRTLGPQQSADLREEIQQSAADYGLYFTDKNRESSVLFTKDRLHRESLDTRHIEETLDTKNYGGLKPSNNYNPQQFLDFEKFAKESRTGMTRAEARNRARNTRVDDFENEAEMREFALPGRKMQASEDTHRGTSLRSEFGDIQQVDEAEIDIHSTLNSMLRGL